MKRKTNLWTDKNNKAVLVLKNIDRKEFNITSEEGLHLIHSRKNKWDWEPEEKWLRSVVVNDEGFVCSCSFPKFGNFGEFSDDTQRFIHTLKTGGEVHFSSKEDGSLCIRSVINGKVILRTRGTLFGGSNQEDGTLSYGKRFLEVAEKKYPILLNPKWLPDVTLLFEYVSPDNTIIIRYMEPDLIFLGVVEHFHPSLWSWDALKTLAEDAGLNLVHLHSLPNTPSAIMDEVKNWRSEGIVARVDRDQVLIKIKSAYYLANHRMKSSMNYNAIVDMVDSSGIISEEDLIDLLNKCNYDWEIVESAKEFYARYIAACKQVKSCLDQAKLEYDRFFLGREILGQLDEKMQRKEYAVEAVRHPSAIKTMMFLLYDGKLTRLHNLIKRLIREEYKIEKGEL